MKTIFLVLALIGFLGCFAQDVIILKNGEEIEAMVTEVRQSEISYKKASNLGGPTYTMPISKIFMIKYQNGDKDVFGELEEERPERPPTPEVTANPVKTAAFKYDPEMGNPYCRVKKQKGCMIHGTRGNEVYFREDIIFYGFDFTYLKLSNPAKVGDGFRIVPKYIVAWNKMLTYELLPFDKMADWMRKPYMLNGRSVFPYHQYMDAQNFVSSVTYCLQFEDIEKIVRGYELREKDGIGMVVNLSNFHKDREYAHIWVTFFDITTREILFAVEATGKAGGMGMTKHWAVGVEEAFRSMFVSQVFRPQRNSNQQIPGKFLDK